MSEKVEKIETMVDRFLAKADKLLKNLSGVSNMAVELADGNKLYVESEDGELVGKMAYVADAEGNPTEQVAPEGDHALIDGRTISVDAAGMVTAVNEAAPVDAEKEEMKSTIAALEAQIAAYKQDNSGLQNQLTETAAAVNELIGEVSNLKQMTVGGSFKPSKAYVKPVDKTTTAVVEQKGLGAWGKSIFNSKN
jgi:soluble cytochrome b562